MRETPRQDISIDMEGLIEEQLTLLRSVKDNWQPSDFVPDLAAEDWRERVQELRQGAASLPDEALVILVGNIVTEEALPSYQTWLNRSDILKDETGASPTPWGMWTRGWTAEENRHGDLLSRYLYLSGRVNMRSVEITTHHLIKNGFNPGSENDPYRSIVYVAFQERATKISHANMSKIAEKHGDQTLGRICAAIAGDEARHEEAYKRFFRRIMELDPANAVIAFAETMRQRIAMPARLMSDGTEKDLFSRFAVVAQRTGMYTFRDYAEILGHLVDYWGVGALSGLSGEAARCQDYLGRLPTEYLAKADRIQESLSAFPKEPFDWIFGRSA